MFDTGPLSHFARAGLLDALQLVVGERRAVIPAAVRNELRNGAHLHPSVQAALDATWIETHELKSTQETAAFSKYAERLVSGSRNVGEAAVLALAETLPGCAVIDDAAAHKFASRQGVHVTRTLALLCQAISQGILTAETVSSIADELLETDYRLPFARGEFELWAAENLVVSS
ncbi:MAG: nucleotide-binding protein [Acidimicrobiaceae bacterium]|nr:nucleotide-binding protein [Acidimicrobiaceae bacterium]